MPNHNRLKFGPNRTEYGTKFGVSEGVVLCKNCVGSMEHC